MNTDIRPWGQYTTLLDSPICKVKIITVKPNECTSYQYHFKRKEHWVIVNGSGKVIINDVERKITSGDYLFISRLDKHKIINDNIEEDLVFIETQTGEYFGEDDIVRVEDKYGRI